MLEEASPKNLDGFVLNVLECFLHLYLFVHFVCQKERQQTKRVTTNGRRLVYSILKYNKYEYYVDVSSVVFSLYNKRT